LLKKTLDHKINKQTITKKKERKKKKNRKTTMSTMQKATAVHVTVMYVGTPALLICFVQ